MKTPIPAQYHKAFINLASSLSPENLHCDGEISRAEAQRKYNRLMREWAKLETRVGRIVDEDEVWRLLG
jgi:hypothetical protein